MGETIYRRYVLLRSSGEPRMEVTEFCAALDGGEARPLALVFDTRASDGPLVGYAVELAAGRFEACNCGEVSAHATWREAAGALPALVVAAEDLEAGPWEPIGSDRAAVILHARDHGPDWYAAALLAGDGSRRM